MILYSNSASPFVRKVIALAYELGIEDSIELVHSAGSPTEPASLQDSENPLAKIPTLARASGPALYDSRTICRYLDDLEGGKMYPEPPALWEILTLEATADGIMEAAVLMIYEIRCRPESARSNEWVEAQWSKVDRSLDAIEARWMSHLAGPVQMGQISVGCALGYLDLRQQARNWRKGRPALAKWFEEFSKRRSMQETIPAIPA